MQPPRHSNPITLFHVQSETMHLPRELLRVPKQEGPTEHSSGLMFNVPASLPIFLQRQLQGTQPQCLPTQS